MELHRAMISIGCLISGPPDQAPAAQVDPQVRGSPSAAEPLQNGAEIRIAVRRNPRVGQMLRT